MASSPDIASVAVLFADPSRARMLSALADGRALPASVLASESGVAPSTASGHLARLVAGGALAVEQSGRHRYYRLASADVGAAIEALAALAPQPEVCSLRDSTRSAALRRARSCYDHLAGRLGVAVTQALLDRGVLRRTDGRPDLERIPGQRLAAPAVRCPFAVGPRATIVLADFGVDIQPLLHRPRSARPLVRACVDWSEQRYHVAGALGAAVREAMLASGWITTRPGGRAVEVTPVGRRRLWPLLGEHAVTLATAS